VHNWSGNDFVFSDVDTAVVIFVSIFIYWLLIELHNGLTVVSAGLSRRGDGCNSVVRCGDSIAGSIKSDDNGFALSSMHIVRNNGGIYFWIAIMLLLIILYVQNDNGWGVHGLPHYVPNVYKIAGASVYLRDYLIPIVIAYGLWRGFKIGILAKLVMISLVFAVSATSMSKVSLFVYSLLLVYSVYVSDKFIKYDRKSNYLGLLQILIVAVWVVGVYIVLSLGRMVIMNEGEPVRHQLLLFAGLVFEFGAVYWSSIESSMFLSLIDRFLGFKELASVIYYQDSMDYYVNLQHYILGVDQSSDLHYTSVRGLTGSMIGGGIGLDLLGTLLMTGWLLPFPLAIIAANFFVQRLLLESLPGAMKNAAEFVFMIVLMRIFIDGNFFMLKWFTVILGGVCVAWLGRRYLVQGMRYVSS